MDGTVLPSPDFHKAVDSRISQEALLDLTSRGRLLGGRPWSGQIKEKPVALAG
jgi:hypothetical protein